MAIHRQSAAFPREEWFGLRLQLRKAALSIAANVAEGTGRASDADFCRFLHFAMGSAKEVEVFLEFAKDLGYMQHAVQQGLMSELVEIKRMLAALLKHISP